MYGKSSKSKQFKEVSALHINSNVFSAKGIALVIGLMCSGANAMSIPSMGSSNNYDEFRTSSGMTCRQSLSGVAQFQMGGMVSSDDNNDYNDYSSGYNRGNRNRDEKGIFAQIVIPIGTQDRIECKTLYDIEVEKQYIELKQLKAQLEMLKKQASLAGLPNLPEL
ncbi:MAG: hypothetical protein ACRC9Y_11165 [Aeromonas veronii]